MAFFEVILRGSQWVVVEQKGVEWGKFKYIGIFA